MQGNAVKMYDKKLDVGNWKLRVRQFRALREMSENILKENGDHEKSKLCHFRDRMSVKHSTMETKQVCLFYGKDKITNKNVVVRQFTGESVKQLKKEIKIYELISNQKEGEEKLVK